MLEAVSVRDFAVWNGGAGFLFMIEVYGLLVGLKEEVTS